MEGRAIGTSEAKAQNYSYILARTHRLTQRRTHSNTNTEDHPVFKEELARIEEDMVKKLGQAKHMLDLGCSNEEATFDIEQRAANNTLEVCGPVFFFLKVGVLAFGT